MLAKEEEERLLVQEQARAAKRPRHDILNFKTLVEANEPQEVSNLSTAMNSIVQFSGSRRSKNPEAFVFDDDGKHQSALKDLQEQMQDLKVVSRAKVTMNRIYSAAYHPEVSKDLIFFGGSQFHDVLHWLAQLILQINMVNWESGMLGHHQTKLMRIVILHQKTGKAVSIGAYNYIGQHRPSLLFQISKSTQLTHTT